MEDRTEFTQIRFGMTESEVRNALGDSFEVDGYGAGYYDWWYTKQPVIVSFDSSGKVIGVSVPKRRDSGG